MAFIDYIEYDDAPPELAKIYKKLYGSRRDIANIVRISGVTPKALEGHIALYRGVMAGKNGLTPQQREMIAVVVSGINQCHYCIEHHWTALRCHGDMLDNCPVDDDLKERLVTDWRTANLSDTDKLILGYAETITREAHTIDQAYVDHLKRSGLSDQTIHDAAQVTAYFNYVNRIADALGVELEEE